MIDDNQQSHMLTVREASRLLDVHANTVRRWSCQGIIKSYRIGPRGDRRFKWDDINRLLVEKAEDKGAGASPSTFNSEINSGGHIVTKCPESQGLWAFLTGSDSG